MPESNDILDEISEDEAVSCLRQSIRDAHGAVVIGSGIAERKYGTKKRGSVARQKVPLGRLGRILPEIMDALVVNLTNSLTKVVCHTGPDRDLDVADFELRMTRVLRKVDKLYTQLGTIFYREVLSTEESEVGPQDAVYTGPSKFSSARLQTKFR